MFSSSFFPALGPAAGTLAALATFGVAFVARPFGSILFGHFGDRVVRKATLVTTLLLMGLATFAIGLLPSAASIGSAAPVLLVVLRLCQGLAAGGEWAGAVLLTSEHAPEDRRGTFAMFPQLGPSLAFILASGTFLTMSLTLTSEQFLAFGWRIPFPGQSAARPFDEIDHTALMGRVRRRVGDRRVLAGDRQRCRVRPHQDPTDRSPCRRRGNDQDRRPRPQGRHRRGPPRRDGARHPLGRAGTPEDAANVVYLFCIPESDYITGQIVIAGGGLVL